MIHKIDKNTVGKVCNNIVIMIPLISTKFLVIIHVEISFLYQEKHKK